MNEELAGLLGVNTAKAKEDAFTKGLLGAIFQAAALSGPQRSPVGTAQGLGQIGMTALSGYESSMDKTLEQAIKGLQVKDLLAKRADEERLRKAREEFDAKIKAATTQVPSLGITPGGQQASMLAGQMEGFAPEDMAGTKQALFSAGATRPQVNQAQADAAVMDYLRVAQTPEYAKLIAKEPKELPGVVGQFNAAKKAGFIPEDMKLEDFTKIVNPPSTTNINMPSEGERKAGFLANRIKFGLQQMADVIGAKPPAASPEVLPTLVKFITQSDFLSNKLTSSERQQIEAAQLDILDSALTLGTGAAYTREQLEGYRKSYFPQLGDSPQTIAGKQARLENLLESSYVTAGRAAPPRTERPSFTAPAANAAFPQLSPQDVNLINKHLNKGKK